MNRISAQLENQEGGACCDVMSVFKTKPSQEKNFSDVKSAIVLNRGKNKNLIDLKQQCYDARTNLRVPA